MEPESVVPFVDIKFDSSWAIGSFPFPASARDGNFPGAALPPRGQRGALQGMSLHPGALQCHVRLYTPALDIS